MTPFRTNEKMAALVIAIVMAVAPAAAKAQAETPATASTYIHAGRLIDIPGQRAKTERTIIISGGNIISVLPGYETPPEGAAVIDLKAMTVLPGLIDSHTHLLSEVTPIAPIENLTKGPSHFALRGVANARTTLMAGFTTVQDLGGPNEVIFALRDAIAAGKTPGPRVLASGRQLMSGAENRPGFNMAVSCSGADECARVTRRQIVAGADVIKVTMSGGEPLAPILRLPPTQFFDDELKAIVETAESMEVKVTCHAFTAEAIKRCLRNGVHSIEHGTYLDDEGARMAKRMGARLIPTLLMGPVMKQHGSSYGLDPAIADAFNAQLLETARRAKRIGVSVVTGSDSGPIQHGDNATEFPLFVAAGFTPEEIIQMATIAAAEHLGLETQIGSIEAGKAADIIAVDGDPLSDISELLDIGFVMKDGVVHKSKL